MAFTPSLQDIALFAIPHRSPFPDFPLLVKQWILAGIEAVHCTRTDRYAYM